MREQYLEHKRFSDPLWQDMTPKVVFFSHIKFSDCHKCLQLYCDVNPAASFKISLLILEREWHLGVFYCTFQRGHWG